MKASSAFSARFRYMAACRRKYSSQSMLRRASQGHVRIMSEGLHIKRAHSNPCARGRRTKIFQEGNRDVRAPGAVCGRHGADEGSIDSATGFAGETYLVPVV